MKPTKAAKKAMREMKRMDPSSSVSDSEYKAAMKKLGANKTKNEKEYRKQGY